MHDDPLSLSSNLDFIAKLVVLSLIVLAAAGCGDSTESVSADGGTSSSVAAGSAGERVGRHIANYREPEDARFAFLGVLIHETTHLYQFDAGGGGLVEGLADFVRIRAGHHRMNRRVAGGAWTEPYTTSGFFFSWLAGPGGLQRDGRERADPDIGWAINVAMRGSEFREQVFMERLGADVDTLWPEYQDAL